MSYQRKQPTKHEDKIVWTYWISRDSIDGALSGKCSLWYAKPLRVKHRYRVTWVATDPKDRGHLGDYTPQELHHWFKVYPETDLELIRIDQTPTERMIAESRRQHGG